MVSGKGLRVAAPARKGPAPQAMSIRNLWLEKGLLTAEQWDEANALQAAQGVRLDRALVQLGFLSERQVLDLMGERLHLPVVSLADTVIDPEIQRLVPNKYVYGKRLVPIAREDGALAVATSDPFDLGVFDDLRLIIGLPIKPLLAVREEIEKLIKTHYGVGGTPLTRWWALGRRGTSSPWRRPARICWRWRKRPV